MRTIQRRLASLTKALCPTGKRGFTLEELCRQYWDMNKRGFLALASTEIPALRIFVEIFERQDAGRIASGLRSPTTPKGGASRRAKPKAGR